jgi:hypothetical protein
MPRPSATALWARAAVAVVSSLVALAASIAPASAGRIGPPWMSVVVASQTTVYGTADRTNPVGPLPMGAIVVVIGTQQDMSETPDGWVPSSDITEQFVPWTADVSVPSASMYARSNPQSGVLRTAKQGDLLRVTGVSPGIDGDTSLWWATTDGFIALHSIQATTNPAAQQWALPSAEDATAGWWGLARPANVRAGPSTNAPVVGQFAGGEHVKVLSQEEGSPVNGNSTWYRIDGGRFAGAHVHSSLITRLPDPQPTIVQPDTAVGSDPWIVVNRAAHTLTLVRNGTPQFTTYVSLGEAGVETTDGTYATFIKYREDRMTSTTVPDANHAYDLPNVPFTEYFKPDGSAIHGTYWHDLFGTNQSQGCINVTWTDGAYLFDQTKPTIPVDQIGFAIDPAQATPVVIMN